MLPCCLGSGAASGWGRRGQSSPPWPCWRTSTSSVIRRCTSSTSSAHLRASFRAEAASRRLVPPLGEEESVEVGTGAPKDERTGGFGGADAASRQRVAHVAE